MTDLRLVGCLGLVSSVLLGACAASADQQAVTPTPEVDDRPVAVSEMLDPCAKPNLTTVEPGALTFTTSTVPDPPFFLTDEPSDREGFESELAYELAAQLGFRPGEVAWKIVPADLVLSGEFVAYDVAIGGYVAGSNETATIDVTRPYFDEAANPRAGDPPVESALALVPGNPLLTCVDQALNELSEAGTLMALRDRWLDPDQSFND